MVWPILEYETNNDPVISFTLANKGMGPAIIRSTRVKVDNQPVLNWQQALQKLLGPGVHPYSSFSMSGRVLSPGETIKILVPVDADGKPLAAGTSPLADQMNKARFRIAIEVCFSSTLGDSWTLRKEQGARSTTTATSSAFTPSATDFQD